MKFNRCGLWCAASTPSRNHIHTLAHTNTQHTHTHSHTQHTHTYCYYVGDPAKEYFDGDSMLACDAMHGRYDLVDSFVFFSFLIFVNRTSVRTISLTN